jgi:hypothetical protein
MAVKQNSRVSAGRQSLEFFCVRQGERLIKKVSAGSASFTLQGGKPFWTFNEVAEPAEMG